MEMVIEMKMHIDKVVEQVNEVDSTVVDRNLSKILTCMTDIQSNANKL